MIWLKRLGKAIGGLLLALFAIQGCKEGWFGNGDPVLKALPVEPGDAVVALSHHWDGRIVERIGDFYVDDPAVLQRLKGAWVAGGPAPYFLCGYHYSLYVISRGAIKESFDINLERGCNTIVDSAGNPRWFRPSLIERFEKEYKKPRIIDKEFSSLNEARAYHMTVDKAPSFLMMIEPDWVKFDGTLRFDYACTGQEQASVETCVAAALEKVRRAYPGELFNSRNAGSTGMDGRTLEVALALDCKASFKEHFTLFELKKDAWAPFSPKLRVVFKP